MLRSSALLCVLAATLGLSSVACSGIRVVQKTKDGGILALQGIQDDAREKADSYMKGQCPKGYEIVEEGEAVVGQDTRMQSNNTRYGSIGSAQSRDVREWRITYKCKGDATATLRSVTVSM